MGRVSAARVPPAAARASWPRQSQGVCAKGRGGERQAPRAGHPRVVGRSGAPHPLAPLLRRADPLLLQGGRRALCQRRGGPLAARTVLRAQVRLQGSAPARPRLCYQAADRRARRAEVVCSHSQMPPSNAWPHTRAAPLASPPPDQLPHHLPRPVHFALLRSLHRAPPSRLPLVFPHVPSGCKRQATRRSWS